MKCQCRIKVSSVNLQIYFSAKDLALIYRFHSLHLDINKFKL